MIRLKIMMIAVLCAFYGTAWGLVVVQCAMSDGTTEYFQNNIQEQYDCFLDLRANNYDVIHGAGEDFSAAVDDALGICKETSYASDVVCEMLMDYCGIIKEIVKTDHMDTAVSGACDCVNKSAKEGATHCVRIGRSPWAPFNDVSALVEFASQSCDLQKAESFPICSHIVPISAYERFKMQQQ